MILSNLLRIKLGSYTANFFSMCLMFSVTSFIQSRLIRGWASTPSKPSWRWHHVEVVLAIEFMFGHGGVTKFSRNGELIPIYFFTKIWIKRRIIICSKNTHEAFSVNFTACFISIPQLSIMHCNNSWPRNGNGQFPNKAGLSQQLVTSVWMHRELQMLPS